MTRQEGWPLVNFQHALLAHLLQEGGDLRGSTCIGWWLHETWRMLRSPPRQASPGQSVRPCAPWPLVGRMGQASWTLGVSGGFLGSPRRRPERTAGPGGRCRRSGGVLAVRVESHLLAGAPGSRSGERSSLPNRGDTPTPGRSRARSTLAAVNHRELVSPRQSVRHRLRRTRIRAEGLRSEQGRLRSR